MDKSGRKLLQAGYRRFALLFLAVLVTLFPTLAQQKYSAKGLVLAVDKPHRLMTVSLAIARWSDGPLAIA